MVEFVNRVFTGLVSVAVILAVLGALVRAPRRRDLTWLALGLVAGVVGQIVLGGITVLTDLHPAAVQSHFLLSMAIVLDALVLHQRAGEPPGPYRPAVPAELRRLALALAAWATIVLATGTVVTGTGPHGGDEEAPRFGFDITTVARLHGIAVIVLLLGTLWLIHRSRRVGAWSKLERRLSLLVWAIIVQGAIGYTQYFAGVPAGLVLAHVIGSVVVWVAVVSVTFGTRRPVAQAEGTDAAASEPSLAATS
jgi:cytochrome c oxidase assembly protein subunit 15